jgi:hypothetical protein
VRGVDGVLVGWGFLDRDDTLRRLDRIVGGIHELGLRSSMEVEVVRQLLRGRRTISEIVQLVFGQDPSSPEFHSYYVRVWRAVRELEAKGLVSAPLLGREKPYHLTGHGLGVILRISGGQRQVPWGHLSPIHRQGWWAHARCDYVEHPHTPQTETRRHLQDTRHGGHYRAYDCWVQELRPRKMGLGGGKLYFLVECPHSWVVRAWGDMTRHCSASFLPSFY